MTKCLSARWRLSSLTVLVFRPRDIVIDGLSFYRFIFFCFLFCQLPSELAEQKSTKTGHMLGNEYGLKKDVRNLGYTLHLKTGGKKATFFDDFASQWQF